MTETAFNLILALPPEARPINRHLGLHRDQDQDRYPLYRYRHISLVISGCGTQNAAAATTWLHQVHGLRHGDIWINMGIAGHHSHALGEAFLAGSIDDTTTGEHWELTTGDVLSCPGERVVTVTEPDTGYSVDGLVEMEAAGFYRAALGCTAPDRIYCLKVVSDNRDSPAHGINGKLVSQLIEGRLDILDELMTAAASNGE